MKPGDVEGRDVHQAGALVAVDDDLLIGHDDLRGDRVRRGAERLGDDAAVVGRLVDVAERAFCRRVVNAPSETDLAVGVGLEDPH